MAASISTSLLLHHLLRPPPPSPPSLLLSSVIRPLCSTPVSASKCRRIVLHTPLSSTTLFASPSPLRTRHFLSLHSFTSQSSLSHTLSSATSISSEEEEDDEIDETGEYSEDEEFEEIGDEDEDAEFEEIGEDSEDEEFEEIGEYSEDEYEEEKEEEEDDEDVGIEIEKGNGELVEAVGKSSEMVGKDPEVMMRSRREKGMQKISMAVKEKKELASYANSLGKKLKSQLVGKGGVTPNVATSFVETLEANEILKIKIHRSCPGELDEVVKQLEELTASVVVSQIGRTIILYRPSLTKMKEEEKKRQAQKLFAKKASRPRTKPTFLKGGQESRPSNRGRRGAARF